MIVLQFDIRLSHAKQTKRELHPGWTAKHGLIEPDPNLTIGDHDITPTTFRRIVMQKTSRRRWKRVLTGAVERRSFKSLPMRTNSTKPIQPDFVSSLVSCSEGTADRRKHSRGRMLAGSAGTSATDVVTERSCQLRFMGTCDLLFGRGFYISILPTSVLCLERGKFLYSIQQLYHLRHQYANRNTFSFPDWRILLFSRMSQVFMIQAEAAVAIEKAAGLAIAMA